MASGDAKIAAAPLIIVVSRFQVTRRPRRNGQRAAAATALPPPCINPLSPQCDPNDAIDVNDLVIVEDALHLLRTARPEFHR
ncbi:MAG: hypothetical protein H7312_06645 [Tardiphaga sp.]|jgi:hypothetical protein|nr:hypothetical protein [Tardiphaga sp.]